MGFAASVLSGDEFHVSPPAGALVVVHAIQPFGVTLDWHSPAMDTTDYQEKVLTKDVTRGLFGYVVHAKDHHQGDARCPEGSALPDSDGS